MIRFLKISGTVIFVLLIAVIILIIFDFGYIFRGMQATYFQGEKTAFIDDYPHFENRLIEAGTEDEACQIANETWTNARVVDTEVTEMRTISWEVKENK